MPSNIVLGTDKLTIEFYRTFWDILGPDLTRAWTESKGDGELPLSCRRAVLTLLPKKSDLRNWHPVLLVCIDCKVIVKAILLYLRCVHVDMIHPDQTYMVPGHSSTTCT